MKDVFFFSKNQLNHRRNNIGNTENHFAKKVYYLSILTNNKRESFLIIIISDNKYGMNSIS